MSRFRKLSQTIWHCQYHIVWVPKYRYRVLKGAIGRRLKIVFMCFQSNSAARLLNSMFKWIMFISWS